MKDGERWALTPNSDSPHSQDTAHWSPHHTTPLYHTRGGGSHILSVMILRSRQCQG